MRLTQHAHLPIWRASPPTKHHRARAQHDTSNLGTGIERMAASRPTRRPVFVPCERIRIVAIAIIASTSAEGQGDVRYVMIAA
jgi:hypothetical protein